MCTRLSFILLYFISLLLIFCAKSNAKINSTSIFSQIVIKILIDFSKEAILFLIYLCSDNGNWILTCMSLNCKNSIDIWQKQIIDEIVNVKNHKHDHINQKHPLIPFDKFHFSFIWRHCSSTFCLWDLLQFKQNQSMIHHSNCNENHANHYVDGQSIKTRCIILI